MGAQTGIEWTDCTFNIAWGCTKISPGCTNCYADSMSARFGKNIWGPRASRMTMSAEYWAKPLAWDRAAKAAGVRRRVFCSSMCDVFEDHPTIDAERTKLWPLIQATPNLVWQLLTKRADRIAECLPPDWGAGYPNVWLGVSCESDEWLQKRAKFLAMINARVRFLSCEPLLSPIFIGNLPRVVREQINWVIVGGESGPHARQMDSSWARIIRDDCARYSIPFFFKQRGGVDKKKAGRLLDGRTWDEMPAAWNGGAIQS